MDLFLMDAILKGHLPESGRVLDLGCGGGRNGIYFIKNGYQYHGVDEDKSEISLLEYLSKSLNEPDATFEVESIQDFKSGHQFDIIICSRILHFAENKDEFMAMWEKIEDHLAPGGLVYVSIDSAIDHSIGISKEAGVMEFPDGKTRFALTEEIYSQIKKGFNEIEPLKTLVHHKQRAQSFFLLKRNQTHP